MFNCHTGTASMLAIPHKQKKLQYRSNLNDPQRKAEPTIGYSITITFIYQYI